MTTKLIAGYSQWCNICKTRSHVLLSKDWDWEQSVAVLGCRNYARFKVSEKQATGRYLEADDVSIEDLGEVMGGRSVTSSSILEGGVQPIHIPAKDAHRVQFIYVKSQSMLYNELT